MLFYFLPPSLSSVFYRIVCCYPVDAIVFVVHKLPHIIIHGIRARGLTRMLCNRQAFHTDNANTIWTQSDREMDKGIGSSLPTENLDRRNYASWPYKMHQYLLGHRYWSYMEGANDAAVEPTHRDFPTWEQVPSRVLYNLASCVTDHMLDYTRHQRKLGGIWRRFSPQAHQSTSCSSGRR